VRWAYPLPCKTLALERMAAPASTDEATDSAVLAAV
jgi:hypothetical protein